MLLETVDLAAAEFIGSLPTVLYERDLTDLLQPVKATKARAHQEPTKGSGIFRDGNYVTYRYGVEPPQPRHKPLFKGQQRAHVVERIKRRLGRWQHSRFENEGPCRAGIRAQLCLQGVPWAPADQEAADLVANAFRALGVSVRPSWEEGQREYVVPRECCAWCGVDVPNDLMAEKRHYGFCSDVCARSAMLHRDYTNARHETRAYEDARDVIRRAARPARTCECCGKSYRPTSDGGRFCSLACKYEAAQSPPRECQHCGTPFHPKSADLKYCSRECSHAASRKLEARQCAHCGDTFRPRTHSQIYCGEPCARLASRVSVARPCRHCGEMFRPRGSREQHYCSTDCTRAAAMHRVIIVTCHSCGNPFEANTRKARHCSHVCKNLDRDLRLGKPPQSLGLHVFDHFISVPALAAAGMGAHG
jgi:hypothetical protein